RVVCSAQASALSIKASQEQCERRTRFQQLLDLAASSCFLIQQVKPIPQRFGRIIRLSTKCVRRSAEGLHHPHDQERDRNKERDRRCRIRCCLRNLRDDAREPQSNREHRYWPENQNQYSITPLPLQQCRLLADALLERCTQ